MVKKEDTSPRRPRTTAASTGRDGGRLAGSTPAPATILIRHKRVTNDPRYWKEVVDQGNRYWIVKPWVSTAPFITQLPNDLLLALPKADYELVPPKESKGMTR